MLNDKQVDRMVEKLKQYERTLSPYFFEKIDSITMYKLETSKRLYEIPYIGDCKKTVYGEVWGEEGSYCWFQANYEVPEKYHNRDLFIMPHVGGYETMLWVNGIPKGVFANKIIIDTHGNHYCNLLMKEVHAKQKIHIGLEAYAGHYVIGTMPFSINEKSSYRYQYEGVDICVKNQDIIDFVFDLHTLNQLSDQLEESSFERADILNCLQDVHRCVYYAVEDIEEEIWRSKLQEARTIMALYLSRKNSMSAPMAGLVGHSHIDTAWLWTKEETIKKCARTFSNQLSLMEQYPEYRFIQSSVYHLELMNQYYPQLFDKIREKIYEGKYEPNGGVFIECDCNIPSGESLIRQFLWGQRYTQKYFNYSADCFWLPDTFGYSAALPQIMKSCQVDYFLTTKLSWNDTNQFPYESFYWEGIDGTRVFSHFNTTHCFTDPQALITQINGSMSNQHPKNGNYLRAKRVAKQRLIAYGYGDGGGGPQFEMIEMAKRVKDLEGCPKAAHVNVGQFMRMLENSCVNTPIYTGELYLELHRGTLTNQHNIKKDNRKAEQAIYNLELLTVIEGIRKNKPIDTSDTNKLLEPVLINQFHDILPGTCIQEVNELCNDEMGLVLDECNKLLIDKLNRLKIHIKDSTVKNSNVTNFCIADNNNITIINTLGIERNDLVYLDDVELYNDIVNNHNDDNKLSIKIYKDENKIIGQLIENIEGKKQLCIENIHLEAYGRKVIPIHHITIPEICSFQYSEELLITPFAKIIFNHEGTIESFVDRTANRELRGNGLPLNTFLVGEDVPALWDSWDIDSDLEMKMKQSAKLICREVVSNGPLQIRIRSTYQLTSKSIVKQDMICYSHSPQIDFETWVDWQDKHRLWKVDFDVNVKASYARHEIQFGNVQRPTTRNTAIEQAMFEVVNHKYSDLSETKYGIAILNDCKYGISVYGSDIRLSLHKGGCRPDPRGDVGIHTFKYSLLPHNSGFSAEEVIHPAYCFNYDVLVVKGALTYMQPCYVDMPNIIIETVKPCEDKEKAYILRIYEAEGSYTRTRLNTYTTGCKVQEATMLEETISLEKEFPMDLEFRPFEIKTLKVKY